MTKAEPPIEEINTLLFDDEFQEIDSKGHNVNTKPRLLKQKEPFTELEKLEPVPYYKRPIVQAAVLLTFAIPIGWMLISAFSPGEPANSQQQLANSSENKENQLLKDSLKQERKKNQDLAMENGLRTQQMEVISIKPTPTPKTPVGTQPSPAPRRVATPSSQAVPRPASYTVPRRQLVFVRREPSISTTPRASTFVTRTLAPVTRKPSIPTKVESKLDPQEQWLLASNIGVYSGGSKSRDSIDEVKTSKLSLQSTPVTIASKQQLDEGIESPLPNNYTQTPQPINSASNSASRLSVGTTADGRLEKSIAWSGSNSQKITLPKLRVKLLEALKTANGDDVVPAGAYLIAQVENVDNAGFIQLSVTSVQLSDGQETPLPDGAVLIFDKQGKTLQAKFHAPGRGRSFFSHLTDAAGIAGLATNNTGLYVLNALGRERSQSPQPQFTYFSLEQGTHVQIYVDQSFSL